MSGRTSIVVRGRVVTRSDVLSAVALFDELGSVSFLRRHGYRDASRFHLRQNGRSYPSKAILGVAAGLSSTEFFGGASGAAGQLASLGFHVRNSATGALVDRHLDSLRRACVKEGLDVGETPWPDLDVVPTSYFASGSNMVTEIRGLSRAGADIGVTAPHVSAAAEAELVALAGSDVQVFIDSGAFSEVAFGADGPRIVKPIDDASWAKTLGLYRRLAVALGDSLWITAPDCVGFQGRSLSRLYRYRSQVRELSELGARILVPIQKGELSQAEYCFRVNSLLGFDVVWFPALPCKKAATTAAEVARFVSEVRPTHVHLLGKGIRARDLQAYLAPFANGACSVSLDSCWITANVGKTNGPGNGPRRLTRARAMAQKIIARRGSKVGLLELGVYCCLAVGLVR